jgi:hypothetical protein
MTGREMNARAMKILRLVTVVAATAASGCAGGLTAAESTSPEIQALVQANRTYPRWRDFPAPPAPLPSDAAVAAAAERLDEAQVALATQTAAIDWTLEAPEAFAAATRARVDASRAAPVTEQTAATIEAFAESLRERGRAPPPIARRQR